MTFPAEVRVSASVYHMSGDSGTEAYPVSADATVVGALVPMDRQAQVMEGGVFVVQHEFYCDSSSGILVNDKLVISGTTYYVKNVFTANFGTLKHLRCSLSVSK